jgi:hypothetical protein
MQKNCSALIFATNGATFFMNADAAVILNNYMVIDLTVKSEGALFLQLNADVQGRNKSHNRDHRNNCHKHTPATGK